jgi:hypothetical protein
MKTELQTKVIQWIESSAVALKDFTTKEVPKVYLIEKTAELIK